MFLKILKKVKHMLCTVDVARGVSKDYSAFVVLDVTQMPFKLLPNIETMILNLYCFLIQLTKLQRLIIMHMY